jgi:hypothetical protein
MGGMGGGMRSVPPTGLPFANLKAGQTRELPTRLVSLSAPNLDSETGVSLPAKGEKLQLGDISEINADPRLQKALKRLAALKAPESVSQLVMWRLTGMDWAQIAQLSSKWANPHELTLAQEFVDRLDSLTDFETGTILFEIDGADPPTQAQAAALTKELADKAFLGLKTKTGSLPEQPEGPAVACRVRLAQGEATVQVISSDGLAARWVPFGKFSLPLPREASKFEAAKFGDALAKGVLSRLVRAQLKRGPTVKGKPTYQVRIDNASPLVLNGLAVLGTETVKDEKPNQLFGICISPRRSMTVPATEEVVKTLGLKKGIRVVAADLSGL